MTTRELKIAVADSRLSTKWDNSLIDWPTLTERLADPRITHDTVEQFHALPKAKQANIKDVGGFVGGHLAGGRRKKGHVLSRSLLCLDLDTPPVDLLDTLADSLPCQWAVYSTHSHTPQQPRLRLILPMTRDVTGDEYEAIGRRVAADIGIDYCDDTTFEPSRLMYWPSRPIDGDYVYQVNDGNWLNPDAQLARYDNWRDITTWPRSARQDEIIQTRADKQADPLEKPGMVGAFCRAYTIDEAITEFLPDTYEQAGEHRYTYKPGETSAGVVIYDNKFAYSHHGTDPAGGQLLNAFDLVRVHKFGTEDDGMKAGTPANKTPSYQLMVELCRGDKTVKRRLAAEEMAQARADFADAPDEDTSPGVDVDVDAVPDWMDELTRNKSNKIEDTLANQTLILTHDPRLQEIRFNELSGAVDVRDSSKLPWKQVKAGWNDADAAQLRHYLERAYLIYGPTKTSDALSIAASRRSYHPIKDHLEGLPAWDGVPRVDRLLVDYLGADNTDYVRAVTRKTLVAAIARVFNPGCKFDTVLILNGPQGTGKSTLFAKLAGDWFSDALTLTDMRDKTGAEKLQGYWIIELGELAGMPKMDVESVKGFLSRTDDKFRPSYGRVVENHPRQCIIVGTTNAEQGFLRDATGNRRFWPVRITGESQRKAWSMTSDTIKQIWAEAMVYYHAGEQLHLTGRIAEQAQQHQDEAIESDDRIGLVEEYLSTDLPEQWWMWTTGQRLGYLRGGVDEFTIENDVGPLTPRESVSNVEIWAECFGGDPAKMRPQDSYAISAILKKLPNWERSNSGKQYERVFPYGKQRVWRRKADEQPPF